MLHIPLKWKTVCNRTCVTNLFWLPPLTFRLPLLYNLTAEPLLWCIAEKWTSRLILNDLPQGGSCLLYFTGPFFYSFSSRNFLHHVSLWSKTQSAVPHLWHACCRCASQISWLSAPLCHTLMLCVWGKRLMQCVVSSNLNCCSPEMHCVCVRACVRQERDCCWVTMATGSAAMTGLCYHDRGHEDYSSVIVLNVESHNWMFFFFI